MPSHGCGCVCVMWFGGIGLRGLRFGVKGFRVESFGSFGHTALGSLCFALLRAQEFSVFSLL